MAFFGRFAHRTGVQFMTITANLHIARPCTPKKTGKFLATFKIEIVTLVVRHIRSSLKQCRETSFILIANELCVCVCVYGGVRGGGVPGSIYDYVK